MMALAFVLGLVLGGLIAAAKRPALGPDEVPAGDGHTLNAWARAREIGAWNRRPLLPRTMRVLMLSGGRLELEPAPPPNPRLKRRW